MRGGGGRWMGNTIYTWRGVCWCVLSDDSLFFIISGGFGGIDFYRRPRGVVFVVVVAQWALPPTQPSICWWSFLLLHAQTLHTLTHIQQHSVTAQVGFNPSAQQMGIYCRCHSFWYQDIFQTTDLDLLFYNFVNQIILGLQFTTQPRPRPHHTHRRRRAQAQPQQMSKLHCTVTECKEREENWEMRREFWIHFTFGLVLCLCVLLFCKGMLNWVMKCQTPNWTVGFTVRII